MNKQRGTGLPEIMISLLLASLVITILTRHYISVKQHYFHLQKGMDESMELQLVVDFMRDSIRQAGFTPCLRVDRLITLDHRNGHKPLTAIAMDPSLNINRMSPSYNVMLDRAGLTRIVLTSDSSIHDNRPILIADCYHAEVHRVLDVTNTSNGQIVTLANPLAFTYQQPVYVGEWVEEQFFIRSSGGLFYQRGHSDELTPLVKSMSMKIANTLVQISLGLEGKRNLNIETRIRAS